MDYITFPRFYKDIYYRNNFLPCWEFPASRKLNFDLQSKGSSRNFASNFKGINTLRVTDLF